MEYAGPSERVGALFGSDQCKQITQEMFALIQRKRILGVYWV